MLPIAGNNGSPGSLERNRPKNIFSIVAFDILGDFIELDANAMISDAMDDQEIVDCVKFRDNNNQLKIDSDLVKVVGPEPPNAYTARLL